jgi:hypothetical protein
LVEKTTAFKNREKAEFPRQRIRRPEELKTSWSDKAVQWMRSLDIVVVNSNLDVIDALKEQIKATNDRLFPEFLRNRNAKLIPSIPGIGCYGAMLIATDIDDVHGFADAQHLCSYVGLVPSVHQSSSVAYYGRISKQGSRHLQKNPHRGSAHSCGQRTGFTAVEVLPPRGEEEGTAGGDRRHRQVDADRHILDAVQPGGVQGHGLNLGPFLAASTA